MYGRFGVRVSLSGLYMAPKPEYCEYGRCNSASHTCDIAIWVPYISHLAFPNCPNLPYVSQVVWCVGVSPRFRTGWGFILSDFGDGVAESWEMPSSESDRNGLILSDFEDAGQRAGLLSSESDGMGLILSVLGDGG